MEVKPNIPGEPVIVGYMIFLLRVGATVQGVGVNQPSAKLQGSSPAPQFPGVDFGSATPIATAVTTTCTSLHSRKPSTTHSLVHSFHTNPSCSKRLLLLLFEISQSLLSTPIFQFCHSFHQQGLSLTTPSRVYLNLCRLNCFHSLLATKTNPPSATSQPPS
jgi:hypothetical protein